MLKGKKGGGTEQEVLIQAVRDEFFGVLTEIGLQKDALLRSFENVVSVPILLELFNTGVTSFIRS